jgi:hypothetical protein
MGRRRRKRRGRSPYIDAATEAGQEKQREAAFASIKRLYCESLPLWSTCERAYCRRHRCCRGDGKVCLPRTWKLMPPEVQERAYDLVRQGGPRGVPPATLREWHLRGYPPSNFVRSERPADAGGG